MGTLSELAAMKKTYLDKMKAEGKSMLQAGFVEFFALQTDCVGIRWRQYTPYFNDGDPCEFRVGDFGFKFSDTAEDEGDYEDGFENSWGLKGERKKVCAEFVKQFSGHDDLFEIVFGDHKVVTAMHDGFEIEEHEHD